ncbi:FUSC family protein, partial [Enterococcus faecalis]|nr:FUSC family protein [Enterococcus faecalis]
MKQKNLEDMKNYIKKTYLQSYISNEEDLREDFEVRISYNYGLLIQRVIYYYEQTDEIENLNKNSNEEINKLITYLQSVVTVLKENNSIEIKKLIDKSEYYLKNIGLEYTDGVLYTILSHTIHILKLQQEKTYKWKFPEKKHVIKEFRIIKDGFEQFEYLTAVRICLVLTMCFILISILEVPKAIWLPMNAFLLMHPIKEEMNYRIKNRLCGTVIGCLLSFIGLYFIRDATLHILLSGLFGIFVYTMPAGSILQTTLSTVFSLTLTTLAIDSIEAAELRLSFMILAILIVYICSQLFFQFNRSTFFKHSILKITHIHLLFLELCKDKMCNNSDYTKFAKNQILSYLCYTEISEYLKKHESTNEKFIRLLADSY